MCGGRRSPERRSRLARPDRAAAFRDELWDRVGDVAIASALGVGLTATLGSLYYSEAPNFPPRELCWFQPIAMYPMPVLLAVAWWRGDALVRRYVFRSR